MHYLVTLLVVITNKLGSMFTSGSTKANLSGFSKLGEGFKSIAKSAFKPENAFATIAGISGLSGLYTNYINNKREDESMADYQRRLEDRTWKLCTYSSRPCSVCS
jgi:hypothetical protein